MTKCPYVPPHEWEIDFPHLMLRGKAIKNSKKKISFRDKVLASTDMLGKMFSRYFVSAFVNFFNNNKVFRKLLEKFESIETQSCLNLYQKLRNSST